jgi:hypothetical protein
MSCHLLDLPRGRCPRDSSARHSRRNCTKRLGERRRGKKEKKVWYRSISAALLASGLADIRDKGMSAALLASVLADVRGKGMSAALLASGLADVRDKCMSAALLASVLAEVRGK